MWIKSKHMWILGKYEPKIDWQFLSILRIDTLQLTLSWPVMPYGVVRLSGFWYHCWLGDRFFMSRKCGWVMTVSRLSCRKLFVGIWLAIFLKNKPFHLVGCQFPMLSAMPGWHYQRDLIGKLCQLVGVVRVMSLLRMPEIASGRSFKSNNLKELKWRDSIQAENDPLETCG